MRYIVISKSELESIKKNYSKSYRDKTVEDNFPKEVVGVFEGYQVYLSHPIKSSR